MGVPVEILQRSFEQGQARWPNLDLSSEGFGQYVARVQIDDARLTAHAEDLFLVAGVLQGSSAALHTLDHEYLKKCSAVAARIDPSPEFIDDVRQELRLRLFTGPTPKLASYAGIGPLIEWLRVAALRTAINLRRSDHLVATDHLPVQAILNDAENLSLKGWYLDDLRSAIETSFERLATRERTLLRLHFVDQLNIDRIGVIYGVHRGTIARWLVAIRERLFQEAKVELAGRHGLNSCDVKSLYRLLENEVHITISRVLQA